METVLHIGTKKTGSSSIQCSLRDHSEILHANGVLYPNLAPIPQHKVLLFADASDEAMAHPLGIGSADKIAKTRQKSVARWADLEREVQEKTPRTLVLSSEYASGLAKDHLRAVVDRLRRMSKRITIVGYLRAPSAFYLSATQQNVKFGYQLRDPYLPVRYRHIFNKAHDVGADQTVVLPFRRDTFYEGCIFQDFSKRFLGLTEDVRAQLPTTKSNESMSAEGMELMRNFNAWRGKKRRHPGEVVCKKLLATVQHCDAQLGLGRPKLRPSVHNAIVQANRPLTEWLKEQANISLDEPVATEIDGPAPTFEGPNDDLRKFISIDEDALGKLRAKCIDVLMDQLSELGRGTDNVKDHLTGSGDDTGQFNSAALLASRQILAQ